MNTSSHQQSRFQGPPPLGYRGGHSSSGFHSSGFARGSRGGFGGDRQGDRQGGYQGSGYSRGSGFGQGPAASGFMRRSPPQHEASYEDQRSSPARRGTQYGGLGPRPAAFRFGPGGNIKNYSRIQHLKKCVYCIVGSGRPGAGRFHDNDESDNNRQQRQEPRPRQAPFTERNDRSLRSAGSGVPLQQARPPTERQRNNSNERRRSYSRQEAVAQAPAERAHSREEAPRVRKPKRKQHSGERKKAGPSRKDRAPPKEEVATEKKESLPPRRTKEEWQEAVKHIYFSRDDDDYLKIIRFVKNRAYYNKLDIVEIHSFSEKSNFQTSRAVFSLLKYGYFTLYRLRTKTVKKAADSDADAPPKQVLMVTLKRAETFDSIYESFKEQAQAQYKKKQEEEAAAGKNTSSEETKEEKSGEKQEEEAPPKDEEASPRSLDDKGKWWLKGVPKDELEAIENEDEPVVYM